MKVLGIKTSKISTDGKLIAVTYDTDEGPIERVAETEALSAIVQQLAAIIWEAKKLDKSNILSVPSPKRVQVQRTKNRDGVVMRFEMPNKMEQLVALPSEVAERFRVQLGEVLAKPN